MGNLISLLEAKGELIKKALGIENVHIEEKDEVVNFPWFEAVKPEEALAYTKFISAIECMDSINSICSFSLLDLRKDFCNLIQFSVLQSPS